MANGWLPESDTNMMLSAASTVAPVFPKWLMLEFTTLLLHTAAETVDVDSHKSSRLAISRRWGDSGPRACLRGPAVPLVGPRALLQRALGAACSLCLPMPEVVLPPPV